LMIQHSCPFISQRYHLQGFKTSLPYRKGVTLSHILLFPATIHSPPPALNLNDTPSLVQLVFFKSSHHRNSCSMSLPTLSFLFSDLLDKLAACFQMGSF
jgi:hypothetical protein